MAFKQAGSLPAALVSDPRQQSSTRAPPYSAVSYPSSQLSCTALGVGAGSAVQMMDPKLREVK